MVYVLSIQSFLIPLVYTMSATKLPNLFLSKYKSTMLDKHVDENVLSKFQQSIPAQAPILGDLGEYQCDLAFEDTYARFNEGYKVILNLVHVQSRYLYSYLLKNKSEAADKLIEIIPELLIKMTRIRLDAGNEFINKKLTKFFQNNNIQVDIVNKSKKGDTDTLSSYSLGIVEQVNKTVHNLIERVLALKNQSGSDKYRYKPYFNQLITMYNNSPHSDLPYISSKLKAMPQQILNSLIEAQKPVKKETSTNDSNLALFLKLIDCETDKLEKAGELKDKI